MSTVAAALAGSEIALGVLPLGTLNHFAKDMHLPLALEPAIAQIARGAMRRVDVGEVNGRVFINNSSLGLYPDIVRDRKRQQKRLGRGKWPALVWATLGALRRFPFLSVRLRSMGSSGCARTPFVFIGNNAYTMRGFAIGERDRLDSGCLSLYVAQRAGRLRLLQLALRALLGPARSGARLRCARRHSDRRREPAPPPARRDRRRDHHDGAAAALPHPPGEPRRGRPRPPRRAPPART